MRRVRASLAACVALALPSACSSDRPVPEVGWVYDELIDANTWGAPCGPFTDESVKRPGVPGTWQRAWGNRLEPDSMPGKSAIQCFLEFDNETGRLYRLAILVDYEGSFDRADADRLIDELILRYVPFEVELAALSVAFDGVNLGRRTKRVGLFEVVGERKSYPGHEAFALFVSHGKAPRWP